jgi:aryl-alcohol dehydrogenase-like predicted oxidoreductase
MQKIPLGRSGLAVPPVIFGCNIFGWTVDKAQSFKLLDALVDAGLNALDTADVYSYWVPGNKGGESEIIMGEWLKARGRRHDVLLFSKAGMEMPGIGKGLSPAYLADAIDASLKRLQTDVIDLYQSHRDDESVPQEETLAAFEKMIKAGKIRAIGASNFSAPRFKEALDISARTGLPRYETMQPHYNLLERAIEADMLPLCAQEGVGVIPYYSLASGFLSGKYRSEADLGKSPRGARGAGKYLNDKGLKVLAALDKVAARMGATPAQVALAWFKGRPGLAAPIASATTLDQLAELAKAAALTLDAAAVAELDAASA